MVNKCSIFGCKSGYLTTKKRVSAFHFPFEKSDLLEKWVAFVNRPDWKPTKNSVICALHFESKYIHDSGIRTVLRWEEKPIPSIRSQAQQEEQAPEIQPTDPPSKKLLISQKEEEHDFKLADEITLSDFMDLHAPPGYTMFKKENEYVVFYRIEFFDFPKVLESIKIDDKLHVKLQCDGNDVPLPPWFIEGSNGTLARFSDILNFPKYLQSVRENCEYDLLDELQNLKFYKNDEHEHIPFTSNMICLGVLLRYTSAQAYRILTRTFPFPSISALSQYTGGSFDSIKVLEIMEETDEISADMMSIAEELD